MKEAPLRDRLGEALVRENNLIAENAKLKAEIEKLRREADTVASLRLEIAAIAAALGDEETK